MSRKKEEGRKTQKGKLKNKLCFLAAAVAAGTITTEDKKLYGGNVCTVRVTGVTTGNPTTLGSAPGTDAIACGNGAVANGTNSITTGTGAFTGYSGGIAIGENSSAVRESDVAIGAGAGLYNQGLNAKRLPNGNLNTGATRGYNVIIGANAMVGDDNNTSVHTSQGIAIGGSGTTRDAGTRKYGDSGGAWAKGDQSIAIGGDTIAEGHSSIAIGGDDLQKAATKSVTYTLGSGSKTASLLTAMSDLAGVAPGDITSFNATKSGSGAVALGVKSISGDLSLAIGTMSKANKVNATAVGTGAVADLDNSVAIGGGATTVNATGTQETSATINGVTYSNFAGGSGTKVGDVVSIGKNGTFNRQIKNVAAGNISATSTDAVNGSQLYSVAQTLQDRFKYVSINSTETGNADNKGALATNSIAIGPNASATVTAENAVVIGNGAKTTEQVMNSGAPTQWTKTGKNSVVIGNKATTNSEGSVAIGHEAKVDNTTGNSGSTIGRYKNDDNSTYMGTSLAQNNIYADPSYVGTQGIAIGANSYSDYQGMSMGVGARSKNLSLALGYFSNAEGTSSIATGVGAYAKGDNSISSGRQSSTISTGSVALGVAARGGSTADGGLGGSIAVGAASDATHEQAIAIGGITNANTATLEQGRGDNTQATAARATAIGANAKAQAESSIAFGTKANVGSAGTNAVAIGKDSSATIANGVALGSESKATTAAGVTGFDMADGRSNVYSGLAGTAKTANMAAVSVGDGANKTRQITGVAAGKEDTDAVNVAQLKSTNLKIAGNTTSGGADVRLHDQTLTVKGDGTYLTSTAAGNTITMELKQNVKDKIDNAANKNLDNLNPAGVQKIKDTAAWNVVANSGTAQKVEGGDTVKFKDGDNIEITQNGKDFTFATKRNVNFDSVTVPAGAGNVVINNSGINAGGNKITNVDDGTDNDHAVNLGQLNAVKNSPMKFGGDSGTDVDRKLGEKLNVKGGATGNLTNNNIAVEADGNDTLNIKLAENVNLGTNGSVKIGDSTLNNNGLTITGGPSITKTGGINAGGNKITNVADGTVGAGSTDAVNGGQLHDVKTSVTNNTTALNNLKSNTIKLSGDSTSTTAERLDKNGGIEFGVKSGDTHYLTSTATGTDITLDLTPDAKAKINKVSTLASNTVSLGGDTGTTNTQALDKTGGIKFNVKGGATGNLTSNNIAVEANGNDTLNIKLAENVNLGTNGSVKIGDSTLNNNGLTITGGPSITKTGGINAGGKTISNVADGTANDHAVNLGQLNTAINNATATATSTEKVVASTAADNIATVAPSTGQNLGDKNATYEVTVSKTAVQNIAKDAAAWNVVANSGTAQKVEGGDTVKFKDGDNIEITQNGKDFTFATKRNVNFDSVTVPAGAGNVVINNSGINAGGNKITNVDDGTDNDHAVNLGQLNAVKNSPMKFGGDSGTDVDRKLGEKLNVKGGATGNLTNNNIAVEADGNDTLNIKLAENVNLGTNGSVKIGDSTLNNNGLTITGGPSITKTGGINAGGKTISNVADGTANDHAVNLGQLNTAINNATATATSTEKVVASTAADNIATVAPSTGQNLGDKNATYEVTVSKTAVQNIAKDAAAWNVVANSGTAQKVQGGDTVKFKDGDNIQITQAGKDFTIATKRDVNFNSVTVPAGAGNVVINNSGINAGGNKITNVDDGTDNDHAVNLGQLNAVKNSPMKFGGDSGTDVDRKLGEKLNIKGGATGNLTSNNIAVEANGNDTLNIKLAENVNLGTNGSVKIGDSTLNNNGLTITGGPSITKTGGINAGGKTISNVADGTANDHAVNLGQLNTAINNATATATSTEKVVASTAADNIATVAPSTGQNLGDKNATYEVTVSKTAVQNIAKDAAAWNVVANSGTAQKVQGGDTVKFKDGDNIQITQAGKDFTIATKRDVNFNSVTVPAGAGNVVINNSGINAGGNKITNVDDGTVGAGSTDAVNGGQLHDVKTSVTNNTTALNNLKSNTIKLSGDSTSTTAERLDKNGGIEFGVKSGDTHYLTSTATGTDITLDLTPDAKAKINKVSTLASNTVSLGGDTGTTNTQALDKTGGIKFNVKGDGIYLTSNAANDDVTLDLTQATKNKINNAATNKLDNLDPAGIQKIKDTAAWNVVANSGTAQKVEGGDTVKFLNGDNIQITQAGKDFTFATKRDVNFNSITVPAGAGNVVINNSGINAGNNKITDVDDGTIAPGSKEAVNGGQLHDVQSTMNAGTFTVSANGGAKDRIAKDENIDFENADGNIAISYDATGNKFTYNLSPNLNLGPAGSLRIGDALLNNGGLTIVNGPSITSTGVDAGNKKVTNVADGTIGAGSKDAINGGQLHDVQTNLQTSINNNAQNIANNTNAINNLNTAVNNPITFTGDSGNNIDRKLGETLNIKGGATGNLTSGNIGVEADSATNTLNVKLAENIDLGTNGSVKTGDTKIDDNGLTINGGPSVTKAGIDAGNKKVTNVANGDITATSKDAVNGSQLHGVADSIKNSIGGNTILNPDGTITTNNIGGTGQNNIHDAIASVNNAANQRTTVIAGDNIDVTVSTNATGGNEYTVATKRDIVVDSVSVANNGPSMNSNGINAGGKTISNLGAGVNPDDAVNVAQLDAVKNSPITFGADTGTDHAATLGSRVSITGDNKNITTSISGNNIQVAMSETPSFGTVNVNDANTGTITGASNVTLDNLDEDGTVGRVATEAQLAAVRNEVAGTKDIDNKLRGFKRGADAGTASAMAMAGIPQVINPGENAIGASISAYKQQTAVAVGYTRASKNGRAVLKISGSVNSNSELGFSLGFMKGWD